MSPPAPPKVLIAHSQTLLGELLEMSLTWAGFRVVRVVEDQSPDGALAAAAMHKPDVALLGMRAGLERTAVETIAPLVASGAMVLILADPRERNLMARCLEAGASGLFNTCQSFGQLLVMISDAAHGHTVLEPWARDELLRALKNERAAEREQRAPFWSLTEVEEEVLKLVAAGKAADEIAEIRFVSVATIRTQIRSILCKLGVNSQLAAVLLVEHAGWPFEASNPREQRTISA